MLGSVSHASLEGVGKTRTAMLLMFVGFATNTLGNATLVYGLFGAPQLGVRGVGIATLASNLVNATLGLSVWLRFARGHGVRIGTRFPDWRPGFLAFLRNGLGNSIREVAGMLKWALLGWVLSWCGTTVMAAYGVAMLWSSILFIPIHAIGRATGILVGQHADEQESRNRFLRLGIRSNLLYSALLIALCFNLAGVLTGLHVPTDWDTNHPGRSLTVLLLTLPAVYFLFRATTTWPGERVVTTLVVLVFVYFLLWSLLCLRHWRKYHP